MKDYNAKILEADFIVDKRTELPHHDTKKWGRRDPSVIKGVVYHQSLDDYGTAAGNAKYHSGPNHISKDGLPGLSYTLFGDRKLSKVVLANDVECITYSQGNRHIPGDENELYLGVCWGGNFVAPGYEPGNDMTPTMEQMQLARDLWAHLKTVFKLEDNQLFGHYHFGKPTCPGFLLMELVDDIRAQYNYGTVLGRDLNTPEGRQAALKALGFYQGALDGEWGPQSKYALTQFQKAHNLTGDGVWGNKTEDAIVAALVKKNGP
jgi:hypothetical protein